MIETATQLLPGEDEAGIGNTLACRGSHRHRSCGSVCTSSLPRQHRLRCLWHLIMIRVALHLPISACENFGRTSRIERSRFALAITARISQRRSPLNVSGIAIYSASLFSFRLQSDARSDFSLEKDHHDIFVEIHPVGASFVTGFEGKLSPLRQ